MFRTAGDNQTMPKTVFNHRCRIFTVCLLALCLSPTTAGTRPWEAWDDIGADRLACTFDATTMSPASIPADKRNGLKHGDHFICLWHGHAHRSFYSRLFGFCPPGSIDFLNAEHHFSLPIRASPFPII
jgi:hypothetical protein